MEPAPVPRYEVERLKDLQDLNILDTPAEERFDRITSLVKELFNVETALVSLIDSERQWFKSKVGIEACESGRDVSFCGHAIVDDEVFVVENAAEDERFSDNPFVTESPHIRFYAGAPVKGRQGYNVGTLCIIDPHPRELSDSDKRKLKDISHWVQLELQYLRFRDSYEELNERNKELEEMNEHMVDRELKMAELKKEIESLKNKLNEDR